MMKAIRFFVGLFILCIAAAALAQIDDTPDGPGESAPAAHDVEPTIPLDKSDPTYDLWKLMRDDLAEGREPGLINVQRFWGGLGWQGMPTFFRLPVALLPAGSRSRPGRGCDHGRAYRHGAWARAAPRGAQMRFGNSAVNTMPGAHSRCRTCTRWSIRSMTW